MRRSNAFFIAFLLGAAVVVGSVAALKTARLGTAGAQRAAVPARVIAHRRATLDRAQISLRKALARRPPKLPPVPTYPAPSIPSPSAGPAPAPAAAPVVKYVRPAPIVVVKHRAGGGDEADHGGDHETEGGND